MLTANGRLKEAYALSSATNNMPEICGRICPQDRLCEGSCVLEQSDNECVTIGSVEKYITDTAWENGWIENITTTEDRPENIGIIGAGPAGLAAAEELLKLGYKVTVYDRHDRAGGLLIYGIPGFKLEKDVVERRTKRLADSGVVFVLNCDIGKDITFDDLRQKHDALLIATGVYKARELGIPGQDLKGVEKALTYLTASNKDDLGDTVPELANGSLNAKGKNVVVIGGGDTAMDCVRTAIRQGAKTVKCLYRRDQANMPGSQREVQNAQEEGVEFVWLSAPDALIGDGAGHVSAVRAARMRLGVADATGRQSPEIIPGSQFVEPADLVIEALGFSPEALPTMFNCPELETTRWGTIKTDPRTFMSTLDGVFAAGDIVRGASLVVWAIRDGRDAVEQIHTYLQSKAETAADVAKAS
jgi:glutamate synthase (NADPH/NADH) small chain